MDTLSFERLLLPLALLLLSVGGCQSLQSRQSNIELEKILSSYQTTVRWSSPEQAYLFLQPERYAKESLPSGLDNIRVTSYEVIRPPIALSEGVVNQTAKISYVLTDRQIERTLMDEQIWEYQAEEKIWYRINPIPEYK
ncbi:MAG: hypothetical protein KDI43_10950 [Gammaproteobacteria bacterium]|nr:hypothetical protein [Gammaproteobacteria bacterium]MCP5405993.1 hypothetical protein [Chromatiaceae bacterium]MCP5408587.1 hypothetical protein [Chromatiaceae bacterium]MCP5442551.1 hypothetical protein [Chromatiaceae bacterium]